MPKIVHVTVKGKTFSSLTALVKHYNMPLTTFVSRRRRGMTIEQALDLEPPTTHKKYNLWLRRTGKERRVCSRCKIEKPLSDYYPKPDGQTGTHGSQCRLCVREGVREGKRRREYGLNPEQWNELFAKQNNSCAICKTTKPGGGAWSTDHCHKTGITRGILCRQCNLMLGFAKDNPDTLHAAIEYLQLHKMKAIIIKEKL